MPSELDRADTVPLTRPQGSARPGYGRVAGRIAGRAARITVWSIVHFACMLVQQVAELLAPLLLVVGIGWAALPHVLGLIQTSDGQARDILNGLASHIPQTVQLGSHEISAWGLIGDGIGLMILAALLSTLLSVLDRELYRGR